MVRGEDATQVGRVLARVAFESFNKMGRYRGNRFQSKQVPNQEPETYTVIVGFQFFAPGTKSVLGSTHKSGLTLSNITITLRNVPCKQYVA